MRPVDIIKKKRDGARLARAEIEGFVAGVADGAIPDYQTAAFLMAVYLRGLDPDETGWLTGAMVDSGGRVDLSDVPGAKVDKHSTGGVGDKTSLIAAPLAAACGVVVPMMSGRGLGHTGGTLDKLEAIPGFRTALSLAELRTSVAAIGCALVGQTEEVAPADRTLYALRDVTGTVDHIPLICASIMSKKLAEGLDGLVLDVKTGRGAFMRTEAEAGRLAEQLVATGQRAGVRTEALVTDMDSPLGCAVGNALEVVEAIETLKGRGPADLERLSIALASRMMRLAGLVPDVEAGERRIEAALSSGAGVEKFRAIVERQGGDPRVVDDYGRLPVAPIRRVVTAEASGFLAAIEAESVGLASMGLGAGRARVEDAVDAAAGIVLRAKPGDRILAGDPVLELHGATPARLDEAAVLARRAVHVSAEPPPARPLVVRVVGDSDDR